MSLITKNRNFRSLIDGAKGAAKELGDTIRHAGDSRPQWLDFTKKVSQLTGHTKLLDLTTGYTNLEKFIFGSNGWTIGGLVFDGIIKTEHVLEVQKTTFPVQTGAIMTDHSIVLPSRLEIQVMVSDANTSPSLADIRTSNRLANYAIDYAVRRFLTNGSVIAGDNRAEAAWAALNAMRLNRVPISVITRLGTYNNMLITKLSTSDDVKTQFALVADVVLEEVQLASVSEVKVSARAQATDANLSGQEPVATETSAKRESTLHAITGKVVQ